MMGRKGGKDKKRNEAMEVEQKRNAGRKGRKWKEGMNG